MANSESKGEISKILFSKHHENKDLAEKMMNLLAFEEDDDGKPTGMLRMKFFDTNKKPENRKVKITVMVEDAPGSE
ncbi:MAG TPA: hypothetical protein P5323_02745 [Candidatus Moranbacteria bacterium]|nr:hypothetical protein [Candidatus Moranbacteria bacterium]HRY28031.1 hypothetical protein [Candidatus Moranbacteria bacterium]HSA07894.1 hypothetical protein [Candidatus Moranbacteria bacterium]